jgi:hypothetical protein
VRLRRFFLGALGVSAATSASVSQLIANAAAKYGVPSQVAMEVAVQESGLNPNAVSPVGAQGVMQLMPATAAQFGVTDPLNPQQNVNAGVQYLSQLYSQYGSWDLALAAYNWGPGNLNNAIAQNPSNPISLAPAETQNYVSSVLTGAGGNYSTSVTPASIASGAVNLLPDDSDSLDSSVDLSDIDSTDLASVGSVDNSYLWIAGALIGGYILLDFLDVI